MAIDQSWIKTFTAHPSNYVLKCEENKIVPKDKWGVLGYKALFRFISRHCRFISRHFGGSQEDYSLNKILATINQTYADALKNLSKEEKTILTNTIGKWVDKRIQRNPTTKTELTKLFNTLKTNLAPHAGEEPAPQNAQPGSQPISPSKPVPPQEPARALLKTADLTKKRELCEKLWNDRELLRKEKTQNVPEQKKITTQLENLKKEIETTPYRTQLTLLHKEEQSLSEEKKFKEPNTILRLSALADESTALENEIYACEAWTRRSTEYERLSKNLATFRAELHAARKRHDPIESTCHLYSAIARDASRAQELKALLSNNVPLVEPIKVEPSIKKPETPPVTKTPLIFQNSLPLTELNQKVSLVNEEGDALAVMTAHNLTAEKVAKLPKPYQYVKVPGAGNCLFVAQAYNLLFRQEPPAILETINQFFTQANSPQSKKAFTTYLCTTPEYEDAKIPKENAEIATTNFFTEFAKEMEYAKNFLTGKNSQDVIRLLQTGDQDSQRHLARLFRFMVTYQGANKGSLGFKAMIEQVTIEEAIRHMTADTPTFDGAWYATEDDASMLGLLFGIDTIVLGGELQVDLNNEVVGTIDIHKNTRGRDGMDRKNLPDDEIKSCKEPILYAVAGHVDFLYPSTA
jgi:hypothetical protein